MTNTQTGTVRGSMFSLAVASAVILSAAGCAADGGAPLEIEARSSAVTLGSVRTYGTAVNVPSSVLLTWIDNYNPNSGYTASTNVWNVRVDDAGNMIGLPRQLAPTTKYQVYARVAYGAPLGQALVVYSERDTSSTGSSSRVKGLRLDSTGAAYGTPFEIEPVGTAGNPRVVYDPNTYRFLVGTTHGASGTSGRYVDNNAGLFSPFSLNPSSTQGTWGYELTIADGKVTTIQTDRPDAYDYLSYLPPFGTSFGGSLYMGEYIYGLRLIYSASADMLGILYNGAGQTDFNVSLKLLPFRGCFFGENCFAYTQVVGRSVSDGTGLHPELDEYAYAGTVIGNKFVTAVRRSGLNAGTTIDLASTSLGGIRQGSTALVSSCLVRELMGMATAVSNTWVYWSCSNGEIRGHQVGQNAEAIGAEKLVVF